MKCSYKGCENKARYCIEWWGLNQHGKNPIVVDESYSCTNPHHLIELSHNPNLGGYPDEINIEPGLYEEPLPKLLALVQQAMDEELKLDTIENIVMISDPPKEQQVFAF